VKKLNQQKKSTVAHASNLRKKKDAEVKIKYDVITPEERDPQPKAYDEIEY
jgi:hypothetical protein